MNIRRRHWRIALLPLLVLACLLTALLGYVETQPRKPFVVGRVPVGQSLTHRDIEVRVESLDIADQFPSLSTAKTSAKPGMVLVRVRFSMTPVVDTPRCSFRGTLLDQHGHEFESEYASVEGPQEIPCADWKPQGSAGQRYSYQLVFQVPSKAAEHPSFLATLNYRQGRAELIFTS